jgi:YD repeat-containing protein
VLTVEGELGVVREMMRRDPLALVRCESVVLEVLSALADSHVDAFYEMSPVQYEEFRAFSERLELLARHGEARDRGVLTSYAEHFRAAQARLDFFYDEHGRIAGLHQTREGRTARLVWDGARVRELVLEVPTAASTADALTGRNAFGLLGPRIARAVLSYVYDPWGRLAEVRDADGVLAQYRLDLRGRMDREKHRSGSLYSMEYDGRGRCTKVSGVDRY